jgi:PAS domain S-box-containing protein
MANSTAWQGKLPEKITCYMLSHKQNKPCSGADHPCPLEDIKKTKQPVIVEHIHYDKDGNPRNVEVHCYPIFDNEQNVTQIIEYCLDITERKRAEEALRSANQQLIASEQQLRASNQQLMSSEQQLKAANQQLIASQEEIQSLANFPSENSNPVLRISKDGIVLYSNEAGMSLLTAWGTQMGRRLPDKWRKFAADVFASGSSKETECDYDDCVLSLTFIPVVDLGYVNIYGLDTTERKKTEETLRSERDKLQTLMGGLALTGIGIDVVSIDYRVLFQNQTLIERFGDITGKLCYEKYMGLKKPCDFCRMTKAIRNKKVESVELTAIDGRSYEILSAPLANPDGTVDKAIEVFKDITENKQAKEALQESELKFKTIFENAGGAIFIADNKTGEILECNSQAEQMLGRPRAEIIGMHQSELHPQGEEEKYKEKFATHVQKGHVVDFEGEVQHKDGRRIPVWIAAQCLKIGGKDVIIGLFMDTTERKKAEQKLIENRAKLKSLASQLSLIEERERHRLATELHDQIGQSLVMSKMKLDSLRQSISSSESTAVIREISDCLGQVIQNTRTLTFDLSSPILYELGFEAAVADWLDEQIREKHGIKTDFEDDGQSKPLDDDIRVLLFRNVRELLVNVVKHANAKNVKVSIRKVDDWICVSVEDDGVGFDVTEVESMVTKKAKFGLFSIRERLESVGGHFEIKSKVGQGSKITMTAPLKYEKITDGA